MAKNFHAIITDVIAGKIDQMSNSDTKDMLKKLGFKDVTRKVFAEMGRARDRNNFTVYDHPCFPNTETVSVSKNNIIGAVEFSRVRAAIAKVVEIEPLRLQKLDPTYEQEADWSQLIIRTDTGAALQ